MTDTGVIVKELRRILGKSHKVGKALISEYEKKGGRFTLSQSARRAEFYIL